MKTRTQYMNHECSHAEYYGQFLTPAIVEAVKSRIGVDRIKQSEDEHFNDIPLAMWDAFLSHPAFQLHERLKGVGDGWSLSGVVCVAKTAARKIKEQAN